MRAEKIPEPALMPHDEPGEPTPFERFERLTRAMLAVPKEEINEKVAEEGDKKRVQKFGLKTEHDG